jgi:hypothetical protein
MSGWYAESVHIVRYVTWPIQNVNLRLLRSVGITRRGYLVSTSYAPHNCAGQGVGISLASENVPPQKG